MTWNSTEEGRCSPRNEALKTWSLSALLILAPWLWGGYPEWTKVWLVGALLLVVSLLAVSERVWSGSFFCRKKIGWVEMVVFLLLVQGWWMVGNALFMHDGEFTQFVPLKQWAQGWPGSVEKSLSYHWMIQCTGLLLLFLLIRHASVPLQTLEGWLTVMAGTGVSIAALGLVQRGLVAPSILWHGEKPLRYFFATFDYHGTAGSFLNIVLPLVTFKAWLAFDRRGTPWEKALWFPGFLIVVAACFVNVSRAASFLSVVLLVLVGVALRMEQRSKSQATQQRWLGALGAVLLGAGLFAALGWSLTERRWQHFLAKDVWTGTGRWLEYQVSGRMVQVTGWFGFGPGTYPVLFPYYSGDVGDRLPGRWLVAHQDYVQTLVEWGWAGASLWASLWLGAAYRIFSKCWKQRKSQSLRIAWVRWGLALVWLGLALHALVDYPLQIISLQIYVAVLLGIIFNKALDQDNRLKWRE